MHGSLPDSSTVKGEGEVRDKSPFAGEDFLNQRGVGDYLATPHKTSEEMEVYKTHGL